MSKMRPGERFFEAPDYYARKIEGLKAEIEYLYYLMIPSGIDYSKPSVMSTPQDIISEYAAHKDDLEAELHDAQKKYIRSVHDVRAVLDMLTAQNPKGAAILEEYYVSHIPFRDIAARYNYSTNHLYKIRNRAISQSLVFISQIKTPTGP